MELDDSIREQARDGGSEGAGKFGLQQMAQDAVEGFALVGGIGLRAVG